MPYIKINDNSQKDFKTLMLFRCTEHQYAKKFLETGNIRFGLPREWIEAYNKYGPGRGDLLEGAFALMKEFDERTINFFKVLRPNAEMIKTEEGYYYFQSRDVLNLRTFCLFGLNDNMFPNQEIAEDKRSYSCGIISKKYFEDFYPDVTEENYDALEEKDKPVLLVINNPHEFFNRIRKFLHNLGLNDGEFVIYPVGYIDKHEPFIVGDGVPGELFNKDLSYSNQSEIRIVICSTRNEILSKFDKANGIFEIGSMKDIAEIQDYYFKDFIMQRRDNQLYYNLSKPTVSESSKELLIGIIYQILCNRLPKGSIEGSYTKEEQIILISKNLKDKYHISFDRKSLTFYADENYQPIGKDDWQRQWTLTDVEDTLSGDGCILYERGEFNEAIQNFTDAIDIASFRADLWYNRGISYYMLGLYENALNDYNQAINLDPSNVKYHSEIARIRDSIKANAKDCEKLIT